MLNLTMYHCYRGRQRHVIAMSVCDIVITLSLTYHCITIHFYKSLLGGGGGDGLLCGGFSFFFMWFFFGGVDGCLFLFLCCCFFCVCGCFVVLVFVLYVLFVLGFLGFFVCFLFCFLQISIKTYLFFYQCMF